MWFSKFVSMWLSGIISIANSNRENTSFWNMPIWISTASEVFFPSDVNSIVQFFMFSLPNFDVTIIIFLLWEFFPPPLADGFSQDFDWEQVSSSVQDFSQYSEWSYQCVLLFPSPSVPAPILWWLFQWHQLKLLSVSLL